MKISKHIISAAVAASLILSIVPAAVSAQTTLNANLSLRKLTNVISRSNTEIDRRIASLNALNTRIQGMKKVSASAKASIASQVQANISGLTSLKAKIDADTDDTTAVTDEKTIFGSYRIYALVIPQGYILASVDRIGNISDLFSTLITKLEARITAAKTAGKDTSAMDALVTDMNAKISDAKANAALAESSVVSLKPDNGDKTIADANHAALVSARADIKTSTTDFKTARADLSQIISSLKSFNSSTSASASSSASQ